MKFDYQSKMPADVPEQLASIIKRAFDAAHDVTLITEVSVTPGAPSSKTKITIEILTDQHESNFNDLY